MKFDKGKISEILKSSADEARKWSLLKWLLNWLFGGSIGALSATLLFGKNLFGLDTVDSMLYALAVICGIVIFLIVIRMLLNYFHEVYKNSTYGNAIIILKDCFAEVHNYRYHRKTDGFQNDEFMKSMMMFCNNLKKIFDEITKSDCCSINKGSRSRRC